jgi:hypothetical protein
MFAGILAGLVILAQCFWMMFEKHTDRVKACLTMLLRRIGAKSMPS